MKSRGGLVQTTEYSKSQRVRPQGWPMAILGHCRKAFIEDVRRCRIFGYSGREVLMNPESEPVNPRL